MVCLIRQLQTSPEYGQGMNPISRLAQIQQAKKEKEPEYILVTERGLPRRREFVMKVGASWDSLYSNLSNMQLFLSSPIELHNVYIMLIFTCKSYCI